MRFVFKCLSNKSEKNVYMRMKILLLRAIIWILKAVLQPEGKAELGTCWSFIKVQKRWMIFILFRNFFFLWRQYLWESTYFRVNVRDLCGYKQSRTSVQWLFSHAPNIIKQEPLFFSFFLSFILEVKWQWVPLIQKTFTNSEIIYSLEYLKDVSQKV